MKKYIVVCADSSWDENQFIGDSSDREEAEKMASERAMSTGRIYYVADILSRYSRKEIITHEIVRDKVGM